MRQTYGMKTSKYWPLWLLVLGIALCGQIPNPSRGVKAGDPEWELMALRQKAEHLNETGEPGSALIYAQKAAAFSEKMNNWPEWGKSKVQESLALYYLNRFKEAEALLPVLGQKGKTAIPSDNDFWGVYYNCAGIVYNALGDFETALKYGLEEIAFYKKNGNTKLLADAYHNISDSYRRKGDFDRAIDYAQSELQIFLNDTTISKENLVWSYNNLSQVYYRKKDFSQAIACSQKSLALLQMNFPEKTPFDFIASYNDLANSYAESGEYEPALEALQKALNLYAKHHLDNGIESTWQNLGFVYRLMGNYPDAEKYLQRALKKQKELYGDKHPSLGKTYRHLGFVANRQGNPRGALAFYQQALRMLTDSFPYQDILANPAVQRVNAYLDFLLTLRDKGETLHQLATQEQNRQFLEASLATYDVAMGLLDTMRAEYQEGSRQFWNREARPIVEGAIGAAMEMNAQTGDTKYLEQAFRYAEKSKALLLADALRESAAKQKAGIPEELLREEKDLKIDIAFYKKQIFRDQQKARGDSSKIFRWQKEIFDRRRSYETLLKKLETSYPEYYRVKYSQPSLSVAAVRQALPSGVGLLEYFSGDSTTYLFYIDETGLKGSSLPNKAGVNDRLERFIGGLRNRETILEHGRSNEAIARFADDAGELYQTLVAPVVEKVPKKLIVIPDGNLSYLPFDLLLTENARPGGDYAGLPYLLLKTAVRYEYSASLALRPAQRQKPECLFAGFAPAYTNEGITRSRGEYTGCREVEAADFSPLGNNSAEVSQIARMLGSEAFLGADATEERLRQYAPKSRILHLAMHGFLNDCDPMYSGLVFSWPQENAGNEGEDSDGILHAYEIYNMRLNADVAVLSACNTGRGQLAKGEGVMSLARAFKYAGCANVLMSLWQADDQATAGIMQSFYQYLKQGMGKDEAIRQAKLDYLTSNQRNHPFFWGAFVLIGNDAPVQVSTQRAGWLLWCLIPLLLFGGWYFFKKRKSDVEQH